VKGLKAKIGSEGLLGICFKEGIVKQWLDLLKMKVSCKGWMEAVVS